MKNECIGKCDLLDRKWSKNVNKFDCVWGEKWRENHVFAKANQTYTSLIGSSTKINAN